MDWHTEFLVESRDSFTRLERDADQIADGPVLVWKRSHPGFAQNGMGPNRSWKWDVGRVAGLLIRTIFSV